MFKTKFEACYDHNMKYWVVLYMKWYQLSWNMLAVNDDPYRFDNKNAAEYMIKCLEAARV